MFINYIPRYDTNNMRVFWKVTSVYFRQLMQAYGIDSILTDRQWHSSVLDVQSFCIADHDKKITLWWQKLGRE
jgi:hypothetical protein